MTRTLPFLAVVTLAVALAGCPRPSTKSAPPSDTEPSVPSVSENAAGQTAPASGLKIAVVPKGTAHVFWKTVEAGARAAGKQYGAQILWNGPAEETDVTGQIAILEDFITQGVSAIVMAACDAKALVPVVQKARGKGIPVITIDSGIETKDALSFVATDNVAGAKMAAQKLAELIGKKGKVGVIPFIKGAATSDMREQGFKEGIAAFPDIQLVSTLYSQSDATQAMQKTEDMLTSVPDLAGIFAANEPAVVGAANVLKQRNLAGKVKLVGFDASDAEVAALKEGVVQALVVQNPFKMGFEGVRLAVQAIKGEKIPERVDTGVTIVTKENLNDPEVQKLLNPPLDTAK
jgi:ribose transport system substrate-binding protein